MLGTPVTDGAGAIFGAAEGCGCGNGTGCGQVAGLVLKTRTGLFIVPSGRSNGDARGHGLNCARRASWFRWRSRVTTSTCNRTWWTARLSTFMAASGAGKRCRAGVDGAGRGSPAARGRSRGRAARRVSPVFKGLLPRATLESVSTNCHGIPWRAQFCGRPIPAWPAAIVL